MPQFPPRVTKAEKAVDATMTAIATVYRKTQVSDETGGYIDSFAQAFTSKCSFARSMVIPLERENAFTVQTTLLWNFSFPARTTVLATDRVMVNGRTFEVISGASSSFELVTRVTCREIT